MVHDLHPTQERLHRILPSVPSPACTFCQSEKCDLPHPLFLCDHNSDVGNWLLQTLRHHLPRIHPQQVVLLDLDLQEHLLLPITWLIAKTLSSIFTCRMEKKPCSLFTTRATLEASIMLLRKTRVKAADILQELLSK